MQYFLMPGDEFLEDWTGHSVIFTSQAASQQSIQLWKSVQGLHMHESIGCSDWSGIL